MLYRIFTMTLLLLGLPLLGCEKPTSGSLTTSSPQEKMSAPEKADKETKEDKDTKEDKVQAEGKKSEKSAEAEKVTSLKKSLDKYHYIWSDDKEADFPLIIELETPPVPEEIKGPFPENAEWRTKEKTPEKKPGKSIWPWN